MRILDFFIYYLTAFYESKGRGGLLWANPLRRATFTAGLTFGLLIFSIIEIIVFLVSKKNYMDSNFSTIVYITGIVLLIQLLVNVYIVNKRYDYIISPRYRVFDLSINTGVIICMTVFFSSILIALSCAIFIK